MDQVASGVEVYEQLPRRWNILKDAMIPPETAPAGVPSVLEPERATVKASALNVRATPSATGKVLRTVARNTILAVEGRAPGNWVRVRLADGTVAYVSGDYVTTARVETDFPVSKDWVPPVTTGLVGNVTD
jgi:hypothetical protein